MTDSFPERGRIAAVNFGTVRIGIAVCDPDWILASPLEVHLVGDPASDREYFLELVQRERIQAFVVGLPIHCDGGESEKSRQCRVFARWLTKLCGLPVRLFDERFTTVAAKQRIAPQRPSRRKTQKKLDAVAALVLLESFLEACRYRGQIAGHPADADSEGGQSLGD